MSVYVHAAIKREVKRLQVVALDAAQECPPAEVSLIHTAIDELNNACASIARRLDKLALAAEASC